MMHVAKAAQYASTGACLDELLASRFLPKRWARRIWSAKDLPVRLQQRVCRMAPNSEWRAYSDDDQVFFAFARPHAPEGARDSTLALDVYFLDRDAAVYSAGVWVHDTQHGWWLDAVLEATYSCEEGWWSDEPEAAPQRQFAAKLADLRAVPARVRKVRS